MSDDFKKLIARRNPDAPSVVASQRRVIAQGRQERTLQPHALGTSPLSSALPEISDISGPCCEPSARLPVDPAATSEAHAMPRPVAFRPIQRPAPAPAQRDEAISEREQEQFALARSPRDVPSSRLCLRCRSVFQSDGFGERICPRCKGSALWKSGTPPRGSGSRQR